MNFAFFNRFIGANIVIVLLLTTNSIHARIDLDLSHTRGFYDSPFQLQITTDDPSAVIKYTTDFEEPTASEGETYTGPISITSTTCIRVFAYSATDDSKTVTHTYLFAEDIAEESYFSDWITNDSRWGPQMVASIKALPIVSIVTPSSIGGSLIACSTEFFNFPHGLNIQENCGVKEFGNYSLNYGKSSRRLYFKSEYGVKKLEANIFEDHEYGIKAVQEFDQLELRTTSSQGFVGSDRYDFIGTKFMDGMMLDMGNLHSHARYAILFENGEYRGIYYIRERMDNNFMESYYGGDKEDYESISFGGNGGSSSWASSSPFDGTGDMWDALVDASDTYQLWKTYINETSFYDHMLSIMWTDTERESKAVGNLTDPTQFIFRANDADQVFNWDQDDLESGNFPDRTDPNGFAKGYDDIFQNIYNEGDPDFFVAFADRVQCSCFEDGVFTPHKLMERIEQLESEINVAIVAEAALYGSESDGEDPNKWKDKLRDVKQYAVPIRTNVMLDDLVNSGLYPTIEGVEHSIYGGVIASGTQLDLENPNNSGDIIYTLNGEDPRLPGGSVNPNAITYSCSGGNCTAAIAMQPGVYEVKARIKNANIWSGMCPYKFYVGQNYNDLVINEIHYNPTDSIIDSLYVATPSSFTKIKETTILSSTTPEYNSDETQEAAFDGDDFTMWTDDFGTPTTSDPVYLQIQQDFSFFANEIILVSAEDKPERDPSSFALLGSNDGISFTTIDSWQNVSWSDRNDAQVFPINNTSSYYNTFKLEIYQNNEDEDKTQLSELIINGHEVKFNDTISGRNFEFIELKNKGTEDIYLNDLEFTKGITVEFKDELIIPANGFVLLAEDANYFELKYGFAPDATYSGKLDNSGENLWLIDPFDNIIDTLRYNDKTPWDSIPDQGLYSLALIDANLDNALASSWAAQSVLVTPKAENIFCPAADPLTLSAVVNPESAAGNSDGSIELSVSGGRAPYQYLWTTNATTEDISNLTSGSYGVTVSDTYNCDVSEIYVVDVQEVQCPENAQFNNNTILTSDTIQVSQFIQSNGILPAGQILTYKAGSYVLLESGFEVETTAVFEALIEGCD